MAAIHAVYSRPAMLAQEITDLLQRLDPDSIELETVVVVDRRHTSWLNPRPIIHTEEALRIGTYPYYVLTTSRLIAIDHHNDGLLKPYTYRDFFEWEILGPADNKQQATRHIDDVRDQLQLCAA